MNPQDQTPVPRDLLELAATAIGSQEALDDLVHDLKGREAAAINNEGCEAQLHYALKNGCSAGFLRGLLQGALTEE